MPVKHEVGECRDCEWWALYEGEKRGVCFATSSDKLDPLGGHRPDATARAVPYGDDCNGAQLCSNPEFGCTLWEERLSVES